MHKPYDDNEYDNPCPNCGGEGVVYICFEDFACIDPEGGCELCERPCDWCKPKTSQCKELRQILAEALATEAQ